MKKLIVLDTFSKIFELRAETDEICEYFGFKLQKKRLNLPCFQGELPRLEQLKNDLEEILPLVNLTTKMSKREMLIAPVVSYLIRLTHAHLRIEYQLNISPQLQGYLDYLIQNEQQFLVIEAKNEDLINGFNQLIVELIALSQWEKTKQQPMLMGAVTTGQIWQFALLDRPNQQIFQDLELLRLPDDLELLMGRLIKAIANNH
jgi:hypothetical protein